MMHCTCAEKFRYPSCGRDLCCSFGSGQVLTRRQFLDKDVRTRVNAGVVYVDEL